MNTPRILFATGSGNDTLATISTIDEQRLLHADELFELKNYIAAMPLFDTLSVHYPQSVLFKLKTGICFLHASSKHDKALLYLQDVKNRKPDLEGIDYYLGRAYLYNYLYDDAIKSFQKYQETPERRNVTKFDVSHFIDYCNNGKNVIKDPLSNYIDNVGKPINTDNSEYVPVIASDESFLIYTYRGERSMGGKQDARNRPDPEGEYYEDIFISYRIGDHWLFPEPLGNINTINHDAAIALSVDGQKLFVFKATKKDKGDIYISYLNGLDWSVPERLNANINTNYWEGSITMSSDEKTIYFTSARPGGFGGRDIYKSIKQADGSWGQALNLGPSINTQYNEDAPFLHPNSKLFYFSSEGHNSIGGYDIFKSELRHDSLAAPVNLGFPINTSSDDKYISISCNGAHAYYSSGVDEGLGQQDIYAITPGIAGKKPQIAVVKGKVTADEKPVKAKITITRKDGSMDFGTFYSNAESGNFLLVLLPFMSYKISYQADGYVTHNEYVNTASLRNAVEVKEDIHLYSVGYALPRVESKDTIGFIYSRLEEELFKLDSMDLNDDKLIALAREREAERRMNIPLNSTSFRIATDATIKRILAQNALLKMPDSKIASLQDSLVAVNPENADKQALKSDIIPVDSTTNLSDNSIANQKSKSSTTMPIDKLKSTAQLPADTSLITPEIPVFGVYYKVQIGAYRHPNNFKYAFVKPLGSVESILLNDGITRFTMGNFETLDEAQKLCKKVKGKGIKDAWITATVNGERKLLEELQQMNLKVVN